MEAIHNATMAMQKTLQCAKDTNERRKSEGLTPFDFGIGLNIGEVMFGNIGVASWFSFFVIGPIINEVERIETLTKVVDV